MGLMLRVVLLVIWLNYTTASITVTRDVKDSFTVQDTSQCHLYNSSSQSPTSCKCSLREKSDFIFNKDKKICVDGKRVFGCTTTAVVSHQAPLAFLFSDICPSVNHIKAYLWKAPDVEMSETWMDVSNDIDQYIGFVVYAIFGMKRIDARFQNFDNNKGHLLKVECTSLSFNTFCKLIKFRGTLEYPTNFTNLTGEPSITVTPATSFTNATTVTPTKNVKEILTVTVTRGSIDSFTVQDSKQCHLYDSSILSPTSCKCDWSKKHDFIFNKDKKIGCADGKRVFDCASTTVVGSSMLELRFDDTCRSINHIKAYLWHLNNDEMNGNWIDISNHMSQYISYGGTPERQFFARFRNFDNNKGHLLKLECLSLKTSCKLIKFKGTLEYPTNFTNLIGETSTTATPTTIIPKRDDEEDDDEVIIVTVSVVIVVLLLLIVFAVVYFFRKRSKGAKRKDGRTDSTNNAPARINSAYTTHIAEDCGTHMELSTPHPYAEVNPDQVYAVIDERVDDFNGNNYTVLQLPSKHHSSRAYTGLNHPPNDNSSTLTPWTIDANFTAFTNQAYTGRNYPPKDYSSNLPGPNC